MIDLKNPETFKHLDPKDVFASTELFPNQCEQILENSHNFSLPQNYKDIKNVVISGMGGSAYGGHVAVSFFKKWVNKPVYVNNNYDLPGYVNEDTLVILSSYSGSTEETISCAGEAIIKRAKVTAVTSGGKLGDYLQSVGVPYLKFDPKNNPSGQPRLGTGYVILGTLCILQKAGILPEEDHNFDETVFSSIPALNDNKENIKEKAIEISNKVNGYMPIIFAGEMFEGNAHIIRNQLNETAKSFSSFHAIPELNHHLMEGLKNPEGRKLHALFLNSSFYSDKIGKRIKLTKDVLDKNNVPYSEFESSGHDMAQMLQITMFGGYLSFYLAILYGQDPSVIPWVDYFKEQLSKSP